MKTLVIKKHTLYCLQLKCMFQCECYKKKQRFICEPNIGVGVEMIKKKFQLCAAALVVLATTSVVQASTTVTLYGTY